MTALQDWCSMDRPPSSCVAAFIGFAAQAKLVRFVSAGASALHTPSLLVLIQVMNLLPRYTNA